MTGVPESPAPTPAPAPESPAPRNVAGAAARAGGIMVFALFLSRLLGMLRDTAMTYQFGIGLDTDAYRIAVQVPDTVFMLVAGGGLQNAFMPMFAELWHKDRQKDAWRAFSGVLSWSFVAATGVVILAWLATPFLIPFFSGTKPLSVMRDAESITRTMLPMQIAFLTGSVLIAVLYARKIFLGPALAPNVYNIGIIVGAIALPRAFGMGIEAMAWGAVVGAFIGNLVIPGFLVWRAGAEFRPKLDPTDPYVRRFFTLLLPVILSFSLPAMANIITQWFASRYETPGSNTVLTLAANLMQAPLGIFGQALALAAFPVLAEFVATDRMDRYRDQVSRTLATVTFLGLVSGAILFALAPNIVHILYGYGKAARSQADLDAVVFCLRLYAPAIAFWCMQPVLMRGFFSLQRTKEPVRIGAVFSCLFIALCAICLWLRPTEYAWLAVASGIAGLGLVIALFVRLEGRVGRLDRARIRNVLVKGSVAALAATAVGWPLGLLAKASGRLAEAGLTMGALLVMAWVFHFVAKRLGMPETEYLDRAFAKIGSKVKR